MFNIIRREIYNIDDSRKNLLPSITIETSNGNKQIYDYIDSRKLDKFTGGDLELSVAYDIYSFNTGLYKAILNNVNEILYINI